MLREGALCATGLSCSLIRLVAYSGILYRDLTMR